jgi:pyruvate,orthophosphate dikinase
MFFDPERILAMREMILADVDARARKRSEAPAVPAEGLHRHLQAMKGLPVTIRLLDPPLHEFLPHEPRARRKSRRRSASSRPPGQAARLAAAREPTRCSVTAAAVSA